MTLAIEVSSPLNSLTKLGPAGESAESNPSRTRGPTLFVWKLPLRSEVCPGEGRGIRGTCPAYREEARTVIVFDNGAVLRLASHFPAGQTVILSNHEGRDVVCRWSARGMFLL